MRKITVVTGTRAEYGLLYWIIKGIHEDPELELQLIVTGMHLSPEFGLTVKEIEKNGFPIAERVEMLLSSDTETAIATSMGLGMIGFAKAYERLRPEVLVVLGDRFEIFSAVSAAMIARIPVAHLHGGEATEGIIDEAIRHSITKMSHLHFTAVDEYKNRVTQMGENPERVFNVGGLGIDNIKNLKLLPRKEFEDSINFSLGARNLIVTFHPVTLENKTACDQFSNLLQALDTLDDVKIIFTKPNADTDGRVIIEMIDDYVSQNKDKTVSFTSMGQLRYLSCLQFVDAMVGNSSSGLSEAPSFKIGTINIGDRQKGRVKADSVIDCDPNKQSIIGALKTLYSADFQRKLKDVKNLYGEGGASKSVVETVKTFPLDNILKKEFYNINFSV